MMYVRPPREEDTDYLALNMRPADIDEVEATSAAPLAIVIREALAASYLPGAVVDGTGKLYALFGIAPFTLVGDKAAPWLLGTPELERHALFLTRRTKVYLAQARQQYPRLENYVDIRNTASIGWLRLMGFQLDDPVPFGYKGLPFHRFHMGM